MQLRLISIFLIFPALLTSGCSSKFESAVTVCENLVKDDLKAPATAVFSNVEIEQLDQASFNISGAVDAQNGFGALLRSEFKCQSINGDIKLISIGE
jgi:hypothetical protein